jgi:cyclophilin family peptidyl-prolyl cis-trans isomerase
MKFKTAGRLAAVASSDNVTSNGSQFFITVDKAEWLDPEKTTVFGQVISGLDTVKKIASVPTDALDRLH